MRQWDMDELFHKLTNFWEQSLMPCLAKKEEGIFTFYFLLTGWIGHWSACNIVPSLHWFPPLEKFEIWAFILPCCPVLIIFMERRTPPSLQFGAVRVTPPRRRGVHSCQIHLFNQSQIHCLVLLTSYFWTTNKFPTIWRVLGLISAARRFADTLVAGWQEGGCW